MDGLVAAGKPVIERVLLPALESVTPLAAVRAETAALALFALREFDPIWSALASNHADIVAGTLRAAALAAPPAFEAQVLQELFAGNPRVPRAALLAVVAARRLRAPTLDPFLQSADPAELTAALRATVSCHGSYQQAVATRLEDGNSTVRMAAMVAGLHTASREAWSMCRKTGLDRSTPNSLSMLLLGGLGGDAEHDALAGLLEHDGHRPYVVRALGYAGQIDRIPHLLALVGGRDERVSRLAVEAIATIAGLEPDVYARRGAGPPVSLGLRRNNARLSARRARAMFGLLTRNVDIWLELFSDRQPYDAWGLVSTQTVLAALPRSDGSGTYYAAEIDGAFGPYTDTAIRTFQRDQGLAVDGIAGPVTRRRLFEMYIDTLTGSPERPLMRPDQFLGDSADNANPKGKAKAAFQGCGEYNPVLLLSAAGEQRYAAQQDKTERNQRNAPNRRVMIFFFSKKRLAGMTPAQAKDVWPCPAWDEGPAACGGQLWPDRGTRLKNGDAERDYQVDRHTMGCSWYDRFARLSPCEGVERVSRSIRLLGFDLEPARESACEIRAGIHVRKTKTDDSGVVTFNAPKGATVCSVRWEVPVANGQSTLTAVREDVLLEPAEPEGTAHRLKNLGHTQLELADQVRSYQREMGQRETGLESDVYAQVKAWHDGGPKPGSKLAEETGSKSSLVAAKGGDPSPAKGGAGKKATVGPKIRVELYQDRSGDRAPGVIAEGTTNDVAILNVPRGSHSAIVLHGAKGLDIRSNNPANAVPNEPDVWVDKTAPDGTRTIGFYGRRFPQSVPAGAGSDDECALFEVYEGGNPTRAVLQVWVQNYPKNYVHLRLLGSALALNDHDAKIVNHPYQMGTRTGPGLHDWSHSRLITDQSAEDMLNEVLRIANQQPGGVLDHLVINAHGAMYPNGAGQILIGDMVKGNFDSTNVDLWDRLNGKLRFVWCMNCICGNDNHLFGTIAKKIQGWTTAMYGYTATKPDSIPPNHIEYFLEPTPKHWDGKKSSQYELPEKTETFFFRARHSQIATVDRSALYFNLVKLGVKLPGKK